MSCAEVRRARLRPSPPVLQRVRTSSASTRAMLRSARAVMVTNGLTPVLPGMSEPPHEMQLGSTERDYYLGLTGQGGEPQ